MSEQQMTDKKMTGAEVMDISGEPANPVGPSFYC